jgi:hypothetical protein
MRLLQAHDGIEVDGEVRAPAGARGVIWDRS